MPIVVSCRELQPGMRLAEAFIYRGRTMLPGAKALTTDDVDVLRRKYPDVCLKVGDPVLDSLIAFEDDGKERAVATEVTQKIAGAMGEVQQKFSQRTNFSTTNFGGIQRTVSGVMQYLKDNPVSAALVNRSGSNQSYIAEHAGNVFYLCMVLGSTMREYVMRERQRQTSASNLSEHVAMDLLPLGLGAMFLDLGMLPLERIYAAGYELSQEDRKAILEHPNTGADMLPEGMPAAARMIVRQHHENFDGSGYPAKLQGDKLHVFVRIARICDAYDAATSEKLYKGAKSATRVLWEMSAGPYRKFYDPVLMKVFAGIIQPFPIGAKLGLADGRTAVVVRYNRKSPFQPNVIVAFDEKGERLPKERLVGPVNVGEENELQLKNFSGEDISYVRELSETSEHVPLTVESFEELVEAAYP